MPWKALHFGTYLSDGLDSLGLEKNRFETGLTDPDSLNGTERLSDYYDDKDDYVPMSRRGPTRKRCATRERGSHPVTESSKS